MSLNQVLEQAREFGFFGPGPVQRQIDHARGFTALVTDLPPDSLVVDLGSGGGVPALVMATELPIRLVMVESMRKRCEFLRWAVKQLAVDAEVIEERAEVVGHGPYRGRAAAVTARGFGPPAVTAECGIPLLVPGGRLVVSEPPETTPRWDQIGLGRLGARADGVVVSEGFRFHVCIAEQPCSQEFPRRSGRPRKQPLF